MPSGTLRAFLEVPMNVFPIAPAESRYFWLLIPVIVILVGVMALLATSLRGARASSFEIRPTFCVRSR